MKMVELLPLKVYPFNYAVNNCTKGKEISPLNQFLSYMRSFYLRGNILTGQSYFTWFVSGHIVFFIFIYLFFLYLFQTYTPYSLFACAIEEVSKCYRFSGQDWRTYVKNIDYYYPVGTSCLSTPDFGKLLSPVTLHPETML